ncbi:uncharacterized protein HGUI_03868 [Hanseniaspora guilliermondii]|uniref:Uncharacterized protein n=1 Tax=Hanseniaspora guilliermondii TaxID=56406 RepID=A0A1L0B939_9ASCO|nr:uncharacterized protein HGUI_03868 [Hanseniaspora guilliermondii]
MYRANQLVIKSFKQNSFNSLKSPAVPTLTLSRGYSIKGKINETLHDLNESTKGASKIIEKTEDLSNKAKSKIEDVKDAVSSSSDDLKAKAYEAKGQVKNEAKNAKKTVEKKVDTAADKAQDKADDIKKNIN